MRLMSPQDLLTRRDDAFIAGRDTVSYSLMAGLLGCLFGLVDGGRHWLSV